MAKAQSAADVRKKFEEQGFEVKQNTGAPPSLEVKKNNFTRRIEPDATGDWIPVGHPSFNVRGLDCELEDHGYQKFWYHQGKRFPAQLRELKALHKFEQEVRYILGLKTLYHESLGSTSARTVYDRVEGRPDPLAGADTETSHHS
jgi:hypothetical protein